VSRHLSRKQIEDCLEPRSYLGETDRLVRRVLSSYGKRRRARGTAGKKRKSKGR
jgi:hypothetical protein